MKKREIVRAWKDVEHREQLSDEERANLPELPVGVYEVDESLLRAATGALASEGWFCSISGECWPLKGVDCNPFN
jgi:mersacidin/lichenicidin family type 2 lantibiotic